MRMIMCATRDSAVNVYGNPFPCRHTGEAIRGFTDAVNASQPSDISNHPDDFELYHVGEFDVDSGILYPLEQPVMLVRGKDVKNKAAA